MKKEEFDAALKEKAPALAKCLMHAIAQGKFDGGYIDTTSGEFQPMEKVLVQPLVDVGFSVDWDAIDFVRGSKTYRRKALKEDPGIAERACFAVPIFDTEAQERGAGQ